MKGTNYLSDVLDVSQLRTGVLNIIDAPCGCGKTTCAINKIAELASSPRKVLYLIDTRIGKERLAREPGLIKPCVFIDGPLDGEPWEKKLVYELRQEKIPVMTYALFGISSSERTSDLPAEKGTPRKSALRAHFFGRVRFTPSPYTFFRGNLI